MFTAAAFIIIAGTLFSAPFLIVVAILERRERNRNLENKED